MKKIISMLTVGALVLGCLSADVALKFTGKAILLGENGNLNLKGYDGKDDENITFKLSNDYAGVYFVYKADANVVQPKATISSGDSVMQPGTMNQYYGWMNFTNVAVQAGIWDQRSVERCSNEADK